MKYIKYLLFIIILVLVYYYRSSLYSFYMNIFVPYKDKVSEFKPNDYYLGNSYSYFMNTTNFVPKSKKDIIDIYFTVVDSGMSEFSFYCDKSYNKCLSDLEDIGNNQELLNGINNFVHPFNSFDKIHTSVDRVGKITLYVDKLYSDDMINYINKEVDRIINDTVSSDSDIESKIKRIHDYIIINADYDIDRSDNNIVKYDSDNAFGVLKDGYGICSGYTDTMMIFLERFSVPNFKISSTNHVWNYVYIDNEWVHLDLTWDDPVNVKDKYFVDYSFFLIKDDILSSIENKEHIYNKEFFKRIVN